MLEALREDLRFAHSLRFPGRAPTWLSSAATVLGSRGMLFLVAHRALQALLQWDPGGPAGRAVRWPRRLAAFLLGFLACVITKSDVRRESIFAPGIFVSPRGHVFLGARTIGRGTLIHDRVTIGWDTRHDGTPRIGADVWIGPNTVIAGNLTIGDGATILPDTVLTRSVPPGALVQGNPGRVIREGFDNTVLRRSAAADPGPFIGAPPPT